MSLLWRRPWQGRSDRSYDGAGTHGEEVTRSGSKEWMEDEEWAWGQLSRLALEYKDGDVEAAQRGAAGYYKGLYGAWPEWGRPLAPVRDLWMSV